MYITEVDLITTITGESKLLVSKSTHASKLGRFYPSFCGVEDQYECYLLPLAVEMADRSAEKKMDLYTLAKAL
jgi:hypothetical protein